MVQSLQLSETPQSPSAPSRRHLKVGLSLAATYLIWGSTYLALRFGLEGFPPFLLNGIRFLIAGGSMYLVLRLRGHTPPTRRQWWNAGQVGALMLVGGVGLVTIAQDLGVGSGVAATAVAVIPLWAALVSGLFGRWPTRLEWVGLFTGFVGVVVLAQEGDFRSSLAGTLLVIAAPMFWAFGSVWASRIDLPKPAMATAAQLLAGGAALSILGPLRGERVAELPQATTWLALAYLIVFGSIVAYTAYIYLLRTVRPALATSYAYANPLVAVLLGVTIGGEVLTGPVFLALPLILLGVAIVAFAPRRTPESEQVRGSKETTFLLTDVVGSTRLWERHPEAMHSAMARHDEILHRTLSENSGRVFSIAGDSFAAAFDCADEALSAALTTQKLLAEEEWAPVEIRVRIGLHSGDAKKRDGRYYGLAVNRAARLAEVAHGGQTLVSCCTRQLLSPVPAGTNVVDLGEHPLRDLQSPERIYQLTRAGLEAEFPPLKTRPQPSDRPAVA